MTEVTRELLEGVIEEADATSGHHYPRRNLVFEEERPAGQLGWCRGEDWIVFKIPGVWEGADMDRAELVRVFTGVILLPFGGVDEVEKQFTLDWFKRVKAANPQFQVVN